ncbi:hypothetical protein [Desulfovibrio inopinatus]|uniref:hypothetical protein n=1 Tax=Desulfovibrio inopinatus TaxID=102109 RepID=UPI000409A05F|nr:hypothetical protein [Desulfovibrio inopinatus]
MDLTIFIKGRGAECFFHCFPPKTKRAKAAQWFKENWIEDRSTTLFLWRYDETFEMTVRQSRTHKLSGRSKTLRKIDEKPLDRKAPMIETDFTSWGSIYGGECQRRQEFWMQLMYHTNTGWYLWRNINAFDENSLTLHLLRYQQIRYDVDNNEGVLINDFYSVLDTITYEGRDADEYSWTCLPVEASADCMRLLID